MCLEPNYELWFGKKKKKTGPPNKIIIHEARGEQFGIQLGEKEKKKRRNSHIF